MKGCARGGKKRERETEGNEMKKKKKHFFEGCVKPFYNLISN